MTSRKQILRLFSAADTKKGPSCPCYLCTGIQLLHRVAIMSVVILDLCYIFQDTREEKMPNRDFFCVFYLYLCCLGLMWKGWGIVLIFCRVGRFLVDKWETIVLPSFLILIGSLEEVAKDSVRHILA